MQQLPALSLSSIFTSKFLLCLVLTAFNQRNVSTCSQAGLHIPYKSDEVCKKWLKHKQASKIFKIFPAELNRMKVLEFGLLDKILTRDVGFLW